MPKKYKALCLILVLAIVIAALIFFLFFKKDKDQRSEGNIRSNYEAMVMIRDQHVSDPAEDRRSSLKKGDVIVIFPEGHSWSDSERAGYLILKIKLTEEEARQLTEPETREIERKIENPENKKEEMMKEMETIQPRKYRLKIEKLKYKEADLMVGKQLFLDKIFDKALMEKRK